MFIYLLFILIIGYIQQADVAFLKYLVFFYNQDFDFYQNWSLSVTLRTKPYGFFVFILSCMFYVYHLFYFLLAVSWLIELPSREILWSVIYLGK